MINKMPRIRNRPPNQTSVQPPQAPLVLVKPSLSGPNRIISAVDSEGIRTQTSSALADVNGTVVATSLFIGPSPENPDSYLGGITPQGMFIPRYVSDQTSWGIRGFNGTLKATTIGQMTFISINMVSTRVGLISNWGVAPTQHRPQTQIESGIAIKSPTGSTVVTEILTITPEGIVSISGDVEVGNIVVGSLCYLII